MSTPTLFGSSTEPVTSDACISPCGLYRYWLTRVWDVGRPVLVVGMVNPSDADASDNDPTVLRLIAFGRRWGYGGLLIVNANALRSPDPSALATAADPVGPDNWAHVRAALMGATGPVLAAWGNNGAFRDGDKKFMALAAELGVSLICLGTTLSGHPKHPLARGKHRVPDDFDPVPFPARVDGEDVEGVRHG